MPLNCWSLLLKVTQLTKGIMYFKEWCLRVSVIIHLLQILAFFFFSVLSLKLATSHSHYIWCMLESSSVQSVWELRWELVRANDQAPSPGFVFFLSHLSFQYSFFMFIIYTTLAAGRVLFALTEKSTWVLIIHISFLSFPINKTNHALILLLCYWG